MFSPFLWCLRWALNGAWPGQWQSERAISGERCDAGHAFDVVKFSFWFRLLDFVISKCKPISDGCFRVIASPVVFDLSWIVTCISKFHHVLDFCLHLVFFIWQGSFSGLKKWDRCPQKREKLAKFSGLGCQNCDHNCWYTVIRKDRWEPIATSKNHGMIMRPRSGDRFPSILGKVVGIRSREVNLVVRILVIFDRQINFYSFGNAFMLLVRCATGERCLKNR